VKFKKIAPDLKTGILYGNMIYKPYDYAKNVGAESLHAEIRTLNQEVIKQSINAGLKIYPYIGGEQFSKEYGLDVMNSGISGIITNFPQEYVKLR
jgi:glycerophosphoryl diester phosphodiesterase